MREHDAWFGHISLPWSFSNTVQVGPAREFLEFSRMQLLTLIIALSHYNQKKFGNDNRAEVKNDGFGC
jgi:hypothetical protein